VRRVDRVVGQPLRDHFGAIGWPWR
jgi:hypothetical protein